MTKNSARDVAASVRARLLALSRERREDFQLVLTRFAIERLLYRLASSRYADRFVLKGATLFVVWTEHPHRATRDLDLLAFGDSDMPALEQVFREVCAIAVEPDGLAFDAASVRGALIREDQAYGGVRIELEAKLGVARAHLQVDVGFGDAVKPRFVTVPALLDLPAPRLRAYPKEAVVAEKFQAMVALGTANSRMKDFYDLWILSRRFAFEEHTLSAAIAATFRRRKTPLPEQAPVALTAAFADDASKRTQWTAFLRRLGSAEKVELSVVVDELRPFLMSVTEELAKGKAAARSWPAGGPWQ